MHNTQNIPSTMASNFTASQSVNNQSNVDTSKERGITNNFNDTRVTTPKKPVNHHNFSFLSYF